MVFECETGRCKIGIMGGPLILSILDILSLLRRFVIILDWKRFLYQ